MCIRTVISCNVGYRTERNDIYIVRQRILALFNAILRRKTIKIIVARVSLESIYARMRAHIHTVTFHPPQYDKRTTIKLTLHICID